MSWLEGGVSLTEVIGYNTAELFFILITKMKHVSGWSLMLSWFLAGCAIPGPTKEEREAAAGVTIHNISLPTDLGGHLYYAQAGDPKGRRVIFIHGTPGDRGAWDGYMSEVPAGRQYIAIDRPSFGASGPPKVLSIWRQIEIIADLLMPSPDATPPVLVGHSYGGTMVALLAALYPDKVGAIVIVAGTVSPYLDHQFALFKFFSYPPMRYLVPRPLNKANDEVIAMEKESQEFPSLWRHVRAPVFVLQGSKDPLVSVENVIYMRQKMVNARLDITVLEGGSHFLIWEEADKVRQLITRAVAAVQ